LDPERIVALRRFEDVVFKRPVLIGDTIHVEVKLVRPNEGRGLEGYEWRILNQRDELVIRAKIEAVVRGEDDPEAEPESEPAAPEPGQPAEGEGAVTR
ncbi:MAG: hypothetical protein M3Q43_10790, partial [Actinomycetota bacterium]|nr:hypothetical protein [Actinomycetota bacterium]